MTRAEPVADGLIDLTSWDETTLLALQDLLTAVTAAVPGAQACVLTLTTPWGKSEISSATGDDPGATSPGLAQASTDPLAVDGSPEGSSLVFLMAERGMTVDPSQAAHATGRVSGFLTAAAALAERDHEIAQLHAALQNRTAIGQAVGLLMAQSGCRAEEATDALKRESQHSNRKLRELAVALITAHEGTVTPTGGSTAVPTRAKAPSSVHDHIEQPAPTPTYRDELTPAPRTVADTTEQPAPSRVRRSRNRVEIADQPAPGGTVDETKPQGAAAADCVLVLHRGGPHAGRLRQIPAALAGQALVYERDLAVYRPETPPRSIDTPQGPAQVWVFH